MIFLKLLRLLAYSGIFPWFECGSLLNYFRLRNTANKGETRLWDTDSLVIDHQRSFSATHHGRIVKLHFDSGDSEPSISVEVTVVAKSLGRTIVGFGIIRSGKWHDLNLIPGPHKTKYPVSTVKSGSGSLLPSDIISVFFVPHTSESSDNLEVASTIADAVLTMPDATVPKSNACNHFPVVRVFLKEVMIPGTVLRYAQKCLGFPNSENKDPARDFYVISKDLDPFDVFD